MSHPPKSLSFSHLGFFVHDLERMERFYTDILGFVATDRGIARGRPLVFLSRDPREHHQIVLVDGRTGALDDRVINQVEKLDLSTDDEAIHARTEEAIRDRPGFQPMTDWRAAFAEKLEAAMA